MEIVLLAVTILITVAAILITLRKAGSLGLFLASFSVFPYLYLGGEIIHSKLLIWPLLILFTLVLILTDARSNVRLPLTVTQMRILSFSFWLVLVTIINVRNVTYDSLAFLGTWLLLTAFIIIWSIRTSQQPISRIARTGDHLIRVFHILGIASIVIGLIELTFPGTVHLLFSPSARVGNIWGSRLADAAFFNKRVASIVGSPNAYGGYLVIVYFVSLISISKRFRIGELAFLIMTLVGVLLMSNSRGALAGIIVGTTVFLFRERYYKLLSLLMAAALIAGIFVSFDSSIENAYISSQALDLSANMPFIPTFLLERAFFWRYVIVHAWQEPATLLFGNGVANADMMDAIAKRGAHNSFISAINFVGIPGLLLMFVLIARFRTVLRAARRTPELATLARMVEYAALGLMVHSLVDDVLIFNATVTAYFLVLAAPLIAAETKFAYRPRKIARGRELVA